METNTAAAESQAKSNGTPHAESGVGIAMELQQAMAQAARFASIQVDLLRLRLTRAAGFAFLALTAAVFSFAVLALSATYLLHGLAGAFTHVTGGPAWVGDLLSGITGLGAIGLAFWLMFRRIGQLALSRSMAKYGRGIQQPEQRSNPSDPRPSVGDRFSSTGSGRSANAVGKVDAQGGSTHRTGA